MDSVITKLDESIFGMLMDQPPRIMICGIRNQSEAGFISKARPDFVCFDSDDPDLRKNLPSAVRVFDSPDELPVICGVGDARALTVDPGILPEDLEKNIRHLRPDTLIIQLKKHSDEELAAVSRLIRAARSAQAVSVD